MGTRWSGAAPTRRLTASSAASVSPRVPTGRFRPVWAALAPPMAPTRARSASRPSAAPRTRPSPKRAACWTWPLSPRLATTTKATRDATIATHANSIKDLETSNIQMAADLKTAKADNDGEKMPTWAVAIIVVIGAMFLLVLMVLGVVVSREQQGKPVFVPSAMKKGVGAA